MYLTDDAIFLPEARVSFMAHSLNNTEPYSGQTLKFVTVLNNNGEGYNFRSGKFSAPRAGIYIFLATLQGAGSQPGEWTVDVDLYQDGSVRQWVRTEADREWDYDSTSMQAVLHLAAGSRVYLMAAGKLGASFYCSFSSVLVTPDP